MKIEQIQIDGFGGYQDYRLEGFQPGLNVIFGPNEAGKTTLFEFIRRVLFGFPDRRSADNDYQLSAYKAAVSGGALFCRLESGHELVIRRRSGPHGGPLTVESGGEILEGKDALDRWFHVSAEFFNNVYAFSLDEIQSLQSLNGDEIRGRIYGAGLGFGKTSPAEIKKFFSNAAAEFCGASGRPARQLLAIGRNLGEIRDRLRQCRQELPQYEQLLATVADLEEKTRQLETRSLQLQQQHTQLELRRRLYRDWVDGEALRQQLAALPDEPLAEDAISRLEKLQAAVDAAKQAAAGSDVERQLADDARKRFTPDRTMLDAAVAIRELQRQLPLYEKTVAELRELQTLRTAAATRSQQLRTELGPQFASLDPAAFSCDLLRRQRSDAIRGELTAADDEVKSLERQRQVEDETRRRMQLERQGTAAKGGLPGWLPAAFLLVVGILAGILAMTVAWWAGTLAGVVGLVMALPMFRRSGPAAVHSEPTLSNLAAELAAAEQRRQDARSAWTALLRELRWPETVTPESFSDVVARLERCRDAQTEEDDLTRRHTAAEEQRQTIAAWLPPLLPLLAPADRNAALPAAVAVLGHRLDQEEQQARQREQTEQNWNVADRRSRNAAAESTAAQSRLTEFLQSCGATDAEDLRRRSAQRQERLRLQSRLDEQLRQMRKLAGTGDVFTQLLREMAQLDPAALEAEMSALAAERDENRQQLSRQTEQLGMVKNQLTTLASHDDLRNLRQQEEAVIDRLRVAAEEWRVNRTAAAIFEAVLQEYENKRQPGVMHQAETVLRQITAGRLENVYRSFENNGVLVRTAAGEALEVGKLSRGSREELFLALRLGLIAEYETARTEPLPVIMDDALVNFDDPRRLAAIAALQTFAAGRQVLALTCHRRTLDEYLTAGAHGIELKGKR